jgi:starvation-inducible DNA-binding protein
MTALPVNIGLDTDARVRVADALAQLLADSYTLYLKTHNYHWNVTGPHFGALHAMFETQYTDLALAVDEIAERIRSLGVFAPGSYAEFAARTKVPEAEPGHPDAMAMVRGLAQDHETVARAAATVTSVAESAGDEPTAGMATNRQEIHEKAAWMLRSFLE